MRLSERMNRRSFPWIVVGVLTVAAAPAGGLAWLATTLQYRTEPPPCYGIGWGCSLSPTDVGGLIAVLWLFGVGFVAGLLLITELFWERVAVARSAATLVAGVIGVVGAVLLSLWGAG